MSLSYLTQLQFHKSTTVKTNRTKQYKEGPTGSIRRFNGGLQNFLMNGTLRRIKRKGETTSEIHTRVCSGLFEFHE